MRNAPQSLRAKVLGRDPQLQSGILRPAAALLHRFLTPQRSRQVEVQLGDRDFQGSGDGEQALGRHVLEAPFELGKIRGRQVGSLCQLAQGPLRFFSPPAKQVTERNPNRTRVFAVSVWHMPWAYASTFLTGLHGACPKAPASSYRQAVGTSLRRISRGLPVVAVAILLGGCAPAAAMRPPASDTPTASPSPNPSASPASSASDSPSPTPTPTPSGVDPAFVPALAAIQMVGPRLGWAVGAHAIFATIDGTHWEEQYASTEEFVAVRFISVSTDWAAAARSLLRSTDGGRSWRQLGEPRVPLRSIHFATATQGWGIAGGSDPSQSHGWL